MVLQVRSVPPPCTSLPICIGAIWRMFATGSVAKRIVTAGDAGRPHNMTARWGEQSCLLCSCSHPSCCVSGTSYLHGLCHARTHQVMLSNVLHPLVISTHSQTLHVNCLTCKYGVIQREFNTVTVTRLYCSNSARTVTEHVSLVRKSVKVHS